MIEVFKTNVIYRGQALWLVEEIQKAFDGYKANFDLDDCDKILRVVSPSGIVQSIKLINFLKTCGYSAEVLSDEQVK